MREIGTPASRKKVAVTVAGVALSLPSSRKVSKAIVALPPVKPSAKYQLRRPPVTPSASWPLRKLSKYIARSATTGWSLSTTVEKPWLARPGSSWLGHSVARVPGATTRLVLMLLPSPRR